MPCHRLLHSIIKPHSSKESQSCSAARQLLHEAPDEHRPLHCDSSRAARTHSALGTTLSFGSVSLLHIPSLPLPPFGFLTLCLICTRATDVNSCLFFGGFFSPQPLTPSSLFVFRREIWEFKALYLLSDFTAKSKTFNKHFMYFHIFRAANREEE